MQLSTEQVIFLVLLLTAMSLVVVGFLVAYVRMFNVRKKQHFMEKEQLKQQFHMQMLQSHLEIQEQTFNQISRELHDNIGQLVGLSIMQLGMLKSKETINPESILNVKANLNAALNDIRNISKSLSGDYMKHVSLEEFLRKTKGQLDEAHSIECKLEVKGREPLMAIEKKIVLIRVFQECIQNVMKHSQAKHLDAVLDCTLEHQLSIQFMDDGKGFDTSNAAYKNGLGVGNIIKRVATLEGKVDFDSKIGKGTKITIKVPVEA